MAVASHATCSQRKPEEVHSELFAPSCHIDYTHHPTLMFLQHFNSRRRFPLRIMPSKQKVKRERGSRRTFTVSVADLGNHARQ
jgi:hypothetical protein